MAQFYWIVESPITSERTSGLDSGLHIAPINTRWQSIVEEFYHFFFLLVPSLQDPWFLKLPCPKSVLFPILIPSQSFSGVSFYFNLLKSQMEIRRHWSSTFWSFPISPGEFTRGKIMTGIFRMFLIWPLLGEALRFFKKARQSSCQNVLWAPTRFYHEIRTPTTYLEFQTLVFNDIFFIEFSYNLCTKIYIWF